jgi:transcriptional regulator with XRE-family HTH domain
MNYITPRHPHVLITPAKCRAARAALQWNQRTLAEAANMSVGPITRYELERGGLMKNNQLAIQRALEAAGITFHGAGLEWDEKLSQEQSQEPSDGGLDLVQGDGTPAKPHTLAPLPPNWSAER